MTNIFRNRTRLYALTTSAFFFLQGVDVSNAALGSVSSHSSDIKLISEPVDGIPDATNIAPPAGAGVDHNGVKQDVAGGGSGLQGGSSDPQGGSSGPQGGSSGPQGGSSGPQVGSSGPQVGSGGTTDAGSPSGAGAGSPGAGAGSPGAGAGSPGVGAGSPGAAARNSSSGRGEGAHSTDLQGEKLRSQVSTEGTNGSRGPDSGASGPSGTQGNGLALQVGSGKTAGTESSKTVGTESSLGSTAGPIAGASGAQSGVSGAQVGSEGTTGAGSLPTSSGASTKVSGTSTVDTDARNLCNVDVFKKGGGLYRGSISCADGQKHTEYTTIGSSAIKVAELGKNAVYVEGIPVFYVSGTGGVGTGEGLIPASRLPMPVVDKKGRVSVVKTTVELKNMYLKYESPEAGSIVGAGGSSEDIAFGWGSAAFATRGGKIELTASGIEGFPIGLAASDKGFFSMKGGMIKSLQVGAKAHDSARIFLNKLRVDVGEGAQPNGSTNGLSGGVTGLYASDESMIIMKTGLLTFLKGGVGASAVNESFVKLERVAIKIKEIESQGASGEVRNTVSGTVPVSSLFVSKGGYFYVNEGHFNGSDVAILRINDRDDKASRSASKPIGRNRPSSLQSSALKSIDTEIGDLVSAAIKSSVITATGNSYGIYFDKGVAAGEKGSATREKGAAKGAKVVAKGQDATRQSISDVVILEKTNLSVPDSVAIYGNNLNGGVFLEEKSTLSGDLLLKATNSSSLSVFVRDSLISGGAHVDDKSSAKLFLLDNAEWRLTRSKGNGNVEANNNGVDSHLSFISLNKDSTIRFMPSADNSGGYQTLRIGKGTGTVYRVNGNANGKANGDAKIYFTANLSAGNTNSGQISDRLLIHGNVVGETAVFVSDSQWFQNLRKRKKRTDDSSKKDSQSVSGGGFKGVSLIQVYGNANSDSFKLKGVYVTTNGEPYKYVLKAYAPNTAGHNIEYFDSSLGNGNGNGNVWDFRLENAQQGENSQKQSQDGGSTTQDVVVVSQSSLEKSNLQDSLVGDMPLSTLSVSDEEAIQKLLEGEPSLLFTSVSSFENEFSIDTIFAELSKKKAALPEAEENQSGSGSVSEPRKPATSSPKPQKSETELAAEKATLAQQIATTEVLSYSKDLNTTIKHTKTGTTISLSSGAPESYEGVYGNRLVPTNLEDTEIVLLNYLNEDSYGKNKDGNVNYVLYASVHDLDDHTPPNVKDVYGVSDDRAEYVIVDENGNEIVDGNEIKVNETADITKQSATSKNPPSSGSSGSTEGVSTGTSDTIEGSVQTVPSSAPQSTGSAQTVLSPAPQSTGSEEKVVESGKKGGGPVARILHLPTVLKDVSSQCDSGQENGVGETQTSYSCGDGKAHTIVSRKLEAKAEGQHSVRADKDGTVLKLDNATIIGAGGDNENSSDVTKLNLTSAVLAEENAEVVLDNKSTIKSSVIGLEAKSGGKVKMTDGTVNARYVGTVARSGSTVNLKDTKINVEGALASAGLVSSGGEITMDSGSISITGGAAVKSESGGHVNLDSVKITVKKQTGVSDSAEKSAEKVEHAAILLDNNGSVDLRNGTVSTDTTALWVKESGDVVETEASKRKKRSSDVRSSLNRANIEFSTFKVEGDGSHGIYFDGAKQKEGQQQNQNMASENVVAELSETAGSTVEKVSVVKPNALSQQEKAPIHVTGAISLKKTNFEVANGIAIYANNSNGQVSLEKETVLAGDLLLSAENNSNIQASLDNSAIVGGTRVGKGSYAQLDLTNKSVWLLTKSAYKLNEPSLECVDSCVSSVSLVNSRIKFVTPKSEGKYQTLHIGEGNGIVYRAEGDASIHLNAHLNPNDPSGEQVTDRLVIHGDVSGRTIVHVQGISEDIANKGHAKNPHSVSIIQVYGTAAKDSFQLDGKYVALHNSPYRYTLRSYSPETTEKQEHVEQKFIKDGGEFWNFRLENQYVKSALPMVGSALPEQFVRAVVPQVPTYLLLPNSVFHAGLMDVNNQSKQLETLRATANGMVEVRENPALYLRGYGGSYRYTSDLSVLEYGYKGDLNYNGVEAGLLLQTIENADSVLSFGVLGSYGKLSLQPVDVEQSQESAFDKWTATAYGSMQHGAGFYIDGLLSYGLLKGDVLTLARGQTATLKGNPLSVSLTGGQTIAIGYEGFVVDPQVQVVYQHLQFEKARDIDNFDIEMGKLDQWIARVGGRVTKTPKGSEGVDAVAFYSKLYLVHGFEGKKFVHFKDAFQLGAFGSSLEAGLGFNAKLSSAFSLHGDIVYQHKLNKAGFSGTSFSGGVRYQF